MTDSSLMLGAEVDQWGEGTDYNNFVPHVFPAVSAAAEKMWSPQKISGAGAVAERISEHVCDLQRAGVGAAPISPGAPCDRLSVKK